MKNGDRVKGIKFPEDDKYNPKGIKGTVVSTDAKYNPIEVLWDNGIKNSYLEKDLQKVYNPQKKRS